MAPLADKRPTITQFGVEAADDANKADIVLDQTTTVGGVPYSKRWRYRVNYDANVDFTDDGFIEAEDDAWDDLGIALPPPD